MAKVEASAERTIGAPADQVYGYLADMSQHPHFLSAEFSGFQVEEGGVGGFFERTFAPRAMRRIYADELDRLNTYAREHRSA